MKKLLFFLCATLAFFGCGSDDGDLPPWDELDRLESYTDNSISNYRTIRIGTQTWMAENLNYNVEGSKCYNNQETNCTTYGRLYDWNTALTVCPSGWHLPTQAEWNTLTSFIQTDKGCSSCDAKHLKSTSGWYNSGNSLDSYGFAALPGGFGSSDGLFYAVGNYGFWWSASENNASIAYFRYMYYSYEYASWNINYKTSLQSVRCVQD